jgi:ADP-heptose:LPS heptosyltransferase
MGDCILLTSTLRALKTEFPGFRISILVEARFAACFDGNPDVEEVIPATTKFRTAAALVKRRFHATVNLHGGSTSLIYACMAWSRRIGGEHYRYAKLYQGRFPAPRADAHTVESTFETFRWLGLRTETPPLLRYESHAAEAGRIADLLRGRRYVVIHPGALMSTKRWDGARFAALAHHLQQEGLTVVLTCGPGEEQVVSQIGQSVPQTMMLLGLTIPELGELIRNARLYVGNDSGPMHLAAAVGTPVLAIWGSSNAQRWRPWGVEHRVVQNPFECNPCPGYRCLVADSPLCIESVTVGQVIAAANELLVPSHAH